MVLGWRRAFCTSIPKDCGDQDSPIITDKPDPSPRLRSRFTGFFSDPSTPTLRCRTTAASSNKPPPESPPKLQCKTRSSPRFFHRSSAPSSPRSPSTFSLLKSSLRLSKSRCGICLQSVKTGQGTAIFTAECGHSFHFPCIAAHVKKQGTLACPVCSFTWKEMHLLNGTATTDHQYQHPHQHQHQQSRGEENRSDMLSSDNSTPKNNNDSKRCVVLKVYNDDEPLSSPTCGARFNPIPESDETEAEEENEEFPGFFVTNNNAEILKRSIEVALLSEAAVVSVGKTSETYAVVLKLRAPAAAPLRRTPIDLVTVLEVSKSITAEKLRLMRKGMRMVVSSLSAADRLSIVAFSTTSKRLLPLRRMTTAGRRSARRIIDAVVSLDGAAAAASATDSLKKAAKVIGDRREENPAASILLFSDSHRGGPLVSSTRFSQSGIPVHSVNLSAWIHAPPEDSFAKCVTGLLSEVAQDLRIQLGFASGSAPAEISAVYSYTGKPALVGSGSSWCRVGDLYSEEERELLIELKIPSSLGGGVQRRLLSVRCVYKDPSTQQTIHDKERSLLIPRPRGVGASTRDIQRLRCLFVTTRAVAESRRMVERNDVAGAHHMLASARALVIQSGSGEEFVRGLEAELAELNWKSRGDQVHPRSRGAELEVRLDEKAEPLTPTSAWRAAERLAKVAIMRKSLNRVSDLHGFENARF